MNEDVQAPDWMVIDAIRYALGRRSYQVNETCTWLMSNWYKLSQATRNIIRRDIEGEFRMASEMGHYRFLGDECDRMEWERVRKLWSK